MRRGFFLLVLLWFLGTGGWLMGDTLPSDPAAAPPQRNWKLTLSGGVTLTSGNTSSQQFNNTCKFAVKGAQLEYLTTLDFLYGMSGDTKTANKGKWVQNLANPQKKRINPFGSLSIEYDEFAGIGLRTNVGLGAQWVFSDRPENRSRIVTSFNGEFVDTTQGLPNRKSVRFNLEYSKELRFSKTSRFSLSSLWTPNLADFARDYRLDALASVSVMMSNPLWLTLKLQNRFNNYPSSSTAKKNDLTFITAVEFTI